MTPADLLAVGRLLWPFLAGAAGCGALAGFLAWGRAPAPAFGRVLLALLGLALLVGLVVAGLGLVRERAGLALEIAVALGLAFALAAGLGAAIRRLLLRRTSADWS